MKAEEKRQKKRERKEFLDNLKTTGDEPSFNCNKCDEKFESMNKVKIHERVVHMRNLSTQTEQIISVDNQVQVQNMETVKEIDAKKETFVNYSCFYCDKIIQSENQIIEHREKCCGSSRLFCFAPLGLSANFRPPKSSHHSTFSFGQPLSWTWR